MRRKPRSKLFPSFDARLDHSGTKKSLKRPSKLRRSNSSLPQSKSKPKLSPLVRKELSELVQQAWQATTHEETTLSSVKSVVDSSKNSQRIMGARKLGVKPQLEELSSHSYAVPSRIIERVLLTDRYCKL